MEKQNQLSVLTDHIKEHDHSIECVLIRSPVSQQHLRLPLNQKASYLQLSKVKDKNGIWNAMLERR